MYTHVNTHHGQVDVVQEFVVVFDGETRVKEHHDFLCAVLLQEREQQQKSLVRWTHDIALLSKIYLNLHFKTKLSNKKPPTIANH